MVRSLTGAQNTYLANNSLTSILLIDIDLSTGSTIRFTDGPYDVTFAGNTYSAQGNFLNISDTDEQADVQITNCIMKISALTLSNITQFAVSSQINQMVVIRRAFINQTTNLLLGDSAGDNAVIIFKGRISGYSVTSQQTTAEITLQISSQFVNFERRNGRKTNLQNFQIEHPNDFGMEFSHISLRDIRWGKV